MPRRLAFLLLVLGFFFPLIASAQPANIYPSLAKAPKALKTGSNDVAVIVAVEDYVFLPHVTGATSNGNDWERFFQDSLGVGSVYFLSNAQGTKEEIERFALLAAQQSKVGGTVWFVFIGHGAPAKNGKEGLLVGSDARQDPNSLFARGLPQQTLLDILQTGQQAKTVLVVDACFSGRANDGSALAPAQPVIPTTLNPTLLENTVILSAAKSDEFAGSLPNMDRPAFSYLLLGAMRGWAADSSAQVTAGSAKSFVERSLRGIPGRMTQTPSLHGRSDVVLTRGVKEADPGIAALMKKHARSPKNKVVQPTHTVIKSTTSAAGIPVLPDSLDPNGAINLSVDAEVLVARDQAIQAESSGVDNPSGAEEAWRKLAVMKGQNPFKEEANTRANQWADFGKKQKALSSQKLSDTDRLKKILPLESVSESNKVELVKNYGSLYGKDDVIPLIRYVRPSAVRHRMCQPYLLSGPTELRIEMPSDRDGVAFRGKVTIGDQEIGVAPATFAMPECAEEMGVTVTEVESGKVWAGTIIDLEAGNMKVMDAHFEDIVPYSIWHDYIMAPNDSGPLLGVMFSHLGFPSDFTRDSASLVRGNVELGIGSFDSHFSVWFEPAAILPQDDQELSWSFAGGGSFGRIPWGRFSFTPLRVGYQQFTGADLADLSGFSGQAALRFHLGEGIQLRGDGGVLRGESTVNGADWVGYIWTAGGGIEYGNDFIHQVTAGAIDNSSLDADEWSEWTNGSVDLGYRLETGFLEDQGPFGSFVAEAKGADDTEGLRLEIHGAPEGVGGFGTSSFGSRLAWAFLNDDETFVMTYGMAAGFIEHADSAYYQLGLDLHIGWHLGAHFSVHAYTQLNALALADVEGDNINEDTGLVEGRSSTMSPLVAYLRWVAPWQMYMQGGVRADIAFSESASGWGEMGYLVAFE